MWSQDTVPGGLFRGSRGHQRRTLLSPPAPAEPVSATHTLPRGWGPGAERRGFVTCSQAGEAGVAFAPGIAIFEKSILSRRFSGKVMGGKEIVSEI